MYQAPQVRPDRGSNSWPPDHDSTFHVTEMPALTTRPSSDLSSTKEYFHIFKRRYHFTAMHQLNSIVYLTKQHYLQVSPQIQYHYTAIHQLNATVMKHKD